MKRNAITGMLFLWTVMFPGPIVVGGIVAATLFLTRYYEGVIIAMGFDLLYLQTSTHAIPWVTVASLVTLWGAPFARAHIRWHS
ncbi:MAG: hypothetical protein ACYC8S_03080 [Minisyncoccota bacterium]